MEWVCPECSLDYGTLHPPIAVNAIKSFPRRFSEALAAAPDEDADAVIRTRPAEGVWSALEYAAHVADSFEPFAVTIDRMNTQDKPDLSDVWWDPDARASEKNYNAMSVDAVIAQMKTNAEHLVKVAEGVDSGSWSRIGEFPWGERDMLTILQNAVHEGVHHLKDIEHGLAKVRP